MHNSSQLSSMYINNQQSSAQQLKTTKEDQQDFNQKIGLIIGGPGSGKTNLINQLIPKQNSASKSNSECDKWKIYECVYSNTKYQLQDTIGIHNQNQCDSLEEFNHTRIEFYLNVNKRKYNRIFIICKNERIAKMKDLIGQCIIPIRKYKSMMTLIITHWDLSSNKVDDESLIRRDILQFFKLDKLILSPSDQQLSKEIYNSLEESNTEIDLKDTSFDIIPQEDPQVMEDLKKLSVYRPQKSQFQIIIQSVKEYWTGKKSDQTETQFIEEKQVEQIEQYSQINWPSSCNQSYVDQRNQVEEYIQKLDIRSTQLVITNWDPIEFIAVGFNQNFDRLMFDETRSINQSYDQPILQDDFLSTYLPFITNQCIKTLFQNEITKDMYLMFRQNRGQIDNLIVIQGILNHYKICEKSNLVLIFETPFYIEKFQYSFNYIRITNKNKFSSMIANLKLDNKQVTQNFKAEQVHPKLSDEQQQRINDQIQKDHARMRKKVDYPKINFSIECKGILIYGWNPQIEDMLITKTQSISLHQQNYSCQSYQDAQNILLPIFQSMKITKIYENTNSNEVFYFLVQSNTQSNKEIQTTWAYLLNFYSDRIQVLIIDNSTLIDQSKHHNYIRIYDQVKVGSMINNLY